MSTYAQDERQGLADDFLRLGPEADTLCDGWRAADLASHLVIRDRRPDAAVGILLPALAKRTARIQSAERDGREWGELVERLRSGPPYPIRLAPLDEAINTLEYFVHREDLLRAQPVARPRQLSGDLQGALWSRLKLMGRLLGRRAPVGVAFDAPGYGRALVKKRNPSVTVSGLPGELALWAFGRQRVADVSLVGDDVSVERLKQADLGI